jgi:hypothetical protein
MCQKLTEFWEASSPKLTYTAVYPWGGHPPQVAGTSNRLHMWMDVYVCSFVTLRFATGQGFPFL